MIEFTSHGQYAHAKDFGEDTGSGYKYGKYYYSHFWSGYPPHTCYFIRTTDKQDFIGMFEDENWKDKIGYIKLVNRKCKLEMI
jgi:hypothetical protein